MEANELILEAATSTAEHDAKKESRNAKGSNTSSDETENLRTTILDATCSPSNIRHPLDFSLLNEAREKLDAMIDFFHETYRPWDKPRTYRKVARKEYLVLAKTKAHRCHWDLFLYTLIDSKISHLILNVFFTSMGRM